MPRTRPVALLAAMVCVLLGLLTTGAVAQQPYPPPPPDNPSGRAEVSCQIDATRRISCRGEGYLAGSEAAVEIRASGQRSRGQRVAAFMVDVDAEGRLSFGYRLGCEYDAAGVRIRVSGRDARDRPTTTTIQLDVPPPPDECSQQAAGRVEPALFLAEDDGVEQGDGDSQDQGDGAPGEGTAPGSQGQGRGQGEGHDQGVAGGRGDGGETTAEGGVREVSAGGIDLMAAVDRTSKGSLALNAHNLLLLLAVALVATSLSAVLVTARRQRRAAEVG